MTLATVPTDHDPFDLATITDADLTRAGRHYDFCTDNRADHCPHGLRAALAADRGHVAEQLRATAHATAAAAHMRTRTGLHATLRAEAGRGDAQTAAAFGVAAATLALLVTATVPDLPVAGRVLWWAAIVVDFAAAGRLAAVIYPQLPPRTVGPPQAVFNAWHVLAADAAGTLTAALDATPDAVLDADDETARLAGLVARKFRHVRAGLRLLATAGALLVLATLTGAVL